MRKMRHWSGRVPRERVRGLLRGLGLRRLAAETFRGFYEDDILTYAAAVAYQALYALFPFIIVLLALFSFLDQPELFQWLLDHSRRFLPGEAYDRWNRWSPRSAAGARAASSRWASSPRCGSRPAGCARP